MQKYGGLFNYLPFKVPELLADSAIDPLDVDVNTLQNNKNPTIRVIGNIVPTVYSFYAVNYMAHVVAKNIINMELKSNSKCLYEGDSAFPFWTAAGSLRYFGLTYKGLKCFNNIGANRHFGKVLSIDRKTMGNR